jgi:hypothetical protein
MSTLMLLLAGGAGAGVFAALERFVKLIIDLRLENRRDLAARRKIVLDATVALVTAKQNSGKDYYAGDVSALFTRLMYLMENDGSAWDKAEYHAEAHGHNARELHEKLAKSEIPGPRE